MSRILDWHDKWSECSVSLARTTQACAIVLSDQVSGSGEPGPALAACFSPLSALLDASRRLAGEPAELIDRTYDITLRLVELHREFAQRLLDTVDLRESRARDLCPGREAHQSAARQEEGRVLHFPNGGAVGWR